MNEAASRPRSVTESLLLDLEAQRGDAMKRADFARLREILHPGLIHVHAKGQIDNCESYFHSAGTHVDYKQIDRSDLKIQVLGDTALMTGRQLQPGRRQLAALRYARAARERQHVGQQLHMRCHRAA